TKEFGKNENDTGSTETQISVLTERIRNITDHLKSNKKDHSGSRGLVILVSKRRKLLHYLRKNNIKSYKNILETLNIPKNLKIGIMINAKDIISNNLSKSEINKIFFEFSKKKKISFIRFACHLSEINKIIPLSNLLNKKGIITAINLMQVSEIRDNEIEKITKLAAKSKLDIFYFADSLGNLEPHNIIHISKLIKKNWKKDIGFHAHDNMGRALINGVTAFNSGINWIDSTVTGMGRGAGNIQTEFALLQFS
ncbi:uncharacterized protein METZ01_LOCUS457194, partial [marine metagenome]